MGRRRWQVRGLVAVMLASVSVSCAPKPESPPPTASAPVTIPADFPLDAGWPADNVDGKREAGQGPVSLDLCSVVPWRPPEPVDSRQLTLNQSDGFRSRAVLLYKSAADAERVLAGTVKRVKACPKVMSEGVDTGWLYRDVKRTGDDVLVLTWWETPNNPTYSTSVYRRGSAVLVSEASGEEGTSRTDAERAAAPDREGLGPALAALTELG